MWYVVWFVLVFEFLLVYFIIIYDECFYIEFIVVNMEEVKVFKFCIVLRGLKNGCLLIKNNFN